MRVLIDSRGLQARVHLEDGQRLAFFVSTLEQIAACQVTFSTGSPLTTEELGGCGVLAITTRYPEKYAYSTAEVTAIQDFVGGGGGLLLMFNHGDLPGSNPHDMTQYDAIIASQFGIRLESAWFQNPAMGELSTFNSASFLTGHPILTSGEKGESVKTIVTHNCSSIFASGRGHALVALPPEMRDLRNGYIPTGRLFVHALDGDLTGGGRLVTMAHSGFIGNEETASPGLGLIRHEDNALFIKNVIRWLGRDQG